MRMLAPILILLAGAGCQRQAPGNQQAQLPDQPAWSGPQGGGQGAEEPVPAPKLDRSHAGTSAPATEFEDPDGEKVSFATFSGKPLLLNLWATWCAPCVSEMPTLDALAGKAGGRLQVVALSQDMNGRDKVGAFFQKHRFKALEAYLDPKMDAMADLKVEVLPTTILYGADGREIWRVTGVEDWRSDRAAKLLAEAPGPAKS
jgi:thiol-disulfide isomerase/thioredoxin